MPLSIEPQPLLMLEGKRTWREPGLDELMMLTLYEHPDDYPRHYVLRAYYIGGGRPDPQPADTALLFRDAQEAAAFVRFAFPRMTFMGRDLDDSPVVAGCWL